MRDRLAGDRDRHRNYTLVDDIVDHQEDIMDHQEDIQEDHEDILENQEDIHEDYQEEGTRNTTEADNSTVVLTVEDTEASMVQEMVQAENFHSSIIIGCSALGVVILVVLILVVLYYTQSYTHHSYNEPDLRARELREEILQTYPTITHNFQVKLMLMFLVRN